MSQTVKTMPEYSEHSAFKDELRNILKQVFNTKQSRRENILQYLESQGICSVKDLKYLEESHSINAYIHPAEKKKLLALKEQYQPEQTIKKEKVVDHAKLEKKRLYRAPMMSVKFLRRFSDFLQEALKLLQKYQQIPGKLLRNAKDYNSPKIGNLKYLYEQKADKIFKELIETLKKYDKLPIIKLTEKYNGKKEAILNHKREQIIKSLRKINEGILQFRLVIENKLKKLMKKQSKKMKQSHEFNLDDANAEMDSEFLNISGGENGILYRFEMINRSRRKIKKSTLSLITNVKKIEEYLTDIIKIVDQMENFMRSGFITNNSFNRKYLSVLITMGFLTKLILCEPDTFLCEKENEFHFVCPCCPEEFEHCRFKKLFQGEYIVLNGVLNNHSKYELDVHRKQITLKKCKDVDEGTYIWMCGKCNVNRQFTLKVHENMDEFLKCFIGCDVTFKYPECVYGMEYSRFMNQHREIIMRDRKMSHGHPRFEFDESEGQISLKQCNKMDEGTYVWMSGKCNVTKKFHLKIYDPQHSSIASDTKKPLRNAKSSGNCISQAMRHIVICTALITINFEILQTF